MENIIKNIAEIVLSLETATLNKELHNKDLYPDEWYCSAGSRQDELHLYRWSKEDGIKEYQLPKHDRQVFAYRDGLFGVPYYNSEVLNSLPKGMYILVYVDDVPTWEDTDREPYTSYDVFEVA